MRLCVGGSCSNGEPKAPSEYALKLDAFPVEDKEKFQAAINRWEAVNKALRDSLEVIQ